MEESLDILRYIRLERLYVIFLKILWYCTGYFLPKPILVCRAS